MPRKREVSIKRKILEFWVNHDKIIEKTELLQKNKNKGARIACLFIIFSGITILFVICRPLLLACSGNE